MKIKKTKTTKKKIMMVANYGTPNRKRFYYI